MKEIENFISKEFSNWHPLESAWMLFCTLFTVGLSLYLQDTAFSIAASLTGVWYTLWAGKGKLSCYFFGIFNSFAYGLISWKLSLYGETLLNWGWYFPMMFAGLFFWRKHLKKDVQEVVKRSLSWRGRLWVFLAAVIGTAVGAWGLYKFNDRAPVIDSFTTVLSIIAMVLTVKRCLEQWILWTLVNLASIYMWYRVYCSGDGSIAILLMWLLSLCNGLIFYYQWTKEVRECPTEN